MHRTVRLNPYPPPSPQAPMNASSLLPSDIMHMSTFSEEWTKPQDTPRDMSMFDSHHPVWPLQDGSLPYNLGNTFQPHEPDTHPSYGRHLHLNTPTLLGGTPDLSYTPLSCASNDSLTPNSSFHPISEENHSPYSPVWDTMRSDEAVVECGMPPSLDLFQDLNNHSNLLRMIPSKDNVFTIHSPKPVFGYQTFQFDLDRIKSPKMDRDHCLPDEIAGRKRRRDDSGDSPADAGECKRPRITLDTLEMPCLFPEPSYPTTLRRQSFVNEASTIECLPTTDMLFDNMYSWDDIAWAG